MKNLTYRNMIFGIRFGKQTFLFKFHDVFNKSWPKMNNLWKKMKQRNIKNERNWTKVCKFPVKIVRKLG